MRHKDKYASPYSKPDTRPVPAKPRVVGPDSTALKSIEQLNMQMLDAIWKTGSGRDNWMVFDEIDWENAWFGRTSTERTIHSLAMKLMEEQERRREIELQEHRKREESRAIERRYGSAW